MTNPSGVQMDGRTADVPVSSLGSWRSRFDRCQPTLQRIDTVENYLMDGPGQNLSDRISAILA